MTADSEVRSRYLALALDARKVIDALIPFVEYDRRDQALDTSVNETILALNSVGEDVVNAVHGTLAFDEYEQVLTLDEIKTQQDRRAVIQDLEQIVSPGDPNIKKEAAMRVLQFFFALESRALQYYSRPRAAFA